MALESSITEKLHKLWELQQIDSQFDEISRLKGELPMEVADLEDDVAQLETRVKNIKATIKEMEQQLAAQQSRVKEADANLKRYKKQMEEVKNDREYNALQREIENADLDIKINEKHIREEKHKIERTKDILKQTEANLAARIKDLDVKKQELKNISEKTESEEKSLTERSKQARSGIDQRLLDAYDRIRATYRNGLAVVTVERNACGGCFNSVPPQIQLEIGMHKKIIACEQCGRILVDQSVAHPAMA
ncbi:MAG: zinc ribbon domain-containing protein [Saprospiraceae bacterium]